MKYSLIIILSLLISLNVFAAPAPPGIMVKGNKCARFNAGDEFFKHSPKKGWKVHIANFDAEKNAIIVSVGDKFCNFIAGKEDACCKELGLKFVQNVKIKTACGPSNTTPECSFDFKSDKKPDTK